MATTPPGDAVECTIDGGVTTCNVSPSFTLTIDLKAAVRSLPNYDLVQIDGQYIPFKQREILSILRTRDRLKQVLEIFRLSLKDDLDPRISTEGTHPYLFETFVNDDPPRLADLRKLVEKTKVSGNYRFYTNTGVNTFLTALKMRSDGGEAGVITADLNQYIGGTTQDT